MRWLKKILDVIFNPIGSLFFPHSSDKIIKKTTRYPFIIYFVALVLTVIVILFVYRDYIFK